MYEIGRGVPQDYLAAYMWFNLAGAHAEPAFRWDEASRTVWSAVEDRDRIAAKLTPAQIAEAQRLSREWTAK